MNKKLTGALAPEPPDKEDAQYLSDLVGILTEHGPKSLGDLRREFGLSPIRLTQCVNDHSDVLSTREVSVGKSHTTLELSLVKESVRLLDPKLEARLFTILKGAGPRGIAVNRLHAHHQISTETTHEFARTHPDTVVLCQRLDQQRRTKEFLSLREEVKPPITPDSSINPQQEIQRVFTPTDEHLLQDRRKLCALLIDGKRLDEWISPQLSWSRIEQLVSLYPNEFEIIPSGNGRQLFVSLRQASIPAPAPEAPPAKPEPVQMPQLSAEEKAKMAWKPASRFGHRGAGSTSALSQVHRTRRPLVQL